MPTTHPIPNPAAEVYAALWLGALLAATGQLRDPLSPEMGDLARRYFAASPRPSSRPFAVAVELDPVEQREAGDGAPAVELLPRGPARSGSSPR